jgi:hypothetical protein
MCDLLGQRDTMGAVDVTELSLSLTMLLSINLFFCNVSRNSRRNFS